MGLRSFVPQKKVSSFDNSSIKPAWSYHTINDDQGLRYVPCCGARQSTFSPWSSERIAPEGCSVLSTVTCQVNIAVPYWEATALNHRIVEVYSLDFVLHFPVTASTRRLDLVLALLARSGHQCQILTSRNTWFRTLRTNDVWYWNCGGSSTGLTKW